LLHGRHDLLHRQLPLFLASLQGVDRNIGKDAFVTLLLLGQQLRAACLRSSSFALRAFGPSLSSTTPARPVERKTRSRLFGSMAIGFSSMRYPRRAVLRTAPKAPGCPSICANAAVSAKRPSMNMPSRMPTMRPMMVVKIIPPNTKPAPTPRIVQPSTAAANSHGVALLCLADSS